MSYTMVKRNWFLLLLIAMLALLVACSDDSEDTATDNNDSTDSNTDNNTDNNTDDNEASEAGLSGTFEIQYFVGGYGDAWWKDAIAAFKKEHPNLEIIEQAGPNVNTEMNTRWVSNDPPDLVYIDGAGADKGQMIKDGQLMDISEWAAGINMEDGTPLLDSFISPVEKFENGAIYTLPLVFDTWGIWYDSAWFEEKGWDIPTDFDSWFASMKKIKEDEGISPFITTGQHPQYFLRGVLQPAFAAAGGNELLNNLLNGNVETWEGPEVLEVMKKVEAIVSAGLVDEGFAAYNHTQSQMNFLLHKNAYIPVGFWLPNEMKNDTPDSLEFGFTPTPMNNAGEPFTLVPDIRTIAVATEAKNPEAAKAFLEFIFTKEYALKFAEATGAIMNLKGVDLSANDRVPQFLKNINDMINDPNEVELYSRITPEGEDLAVAVDMIPEIYLQIVDILLGEITAEQFVENMRNKAIELRK